MCMAPSLEMAKSVWLEQKVEDKTKVETNIYLLPLAKSEELDMLIFSTHLWGPLRNPAHVHLNAIRRCVLARWVWAQTSPLLVSFPLSILLDIIDMLFSILYTPLMWGPLTCMCATGRVDF
eukprot:TRINITY_DN10248_c0_g2_i2.p1 TRINITY_DN10248_c0_g2~~TRINITY_DN10248_c0_g2_i2.p1  ORF type:complete len:121 (+),score=10.62 TRINITY_DN10248_c0_g2_i2:305-667(+)